MNPSLWRLTVLAVLLVPVALARSADPAQDTPPAGPPKKTYGAKSRTDPPSESAEVSVSGGIALEGGDRRDHFSERRAAWAEIGLVARYDAWLNPPASTATHAVVKPKAGRTIGAASRPVDAGGRAIEPAAEAESTGGVEASGTAPAIDRAVAELHTVPEAEALVRQGLSAFKAGEYASAQDAMRRAAELAPGNGIPRFHLALAQFALGAYSGASQSLRQGCLLLPEYVDLGVDVGAFYGSPRDLEEQLRALDSHRTEHGGDPAAVAVCGFVRYGLGDLRAARTAFLSLAAADDRDPLARRFLDAISAVTDEADATATPDPAAGEGGG